MSELEVFEAYIEVLASVDKKKTGNFYEDAYNEGQADAARSIITLFHRALTKAIQNDQLQPITGAIAGCVR